MVSRAKEITTGVTRAGTERSSAWSSVTQRRGVLDRVPPRTSGPDLGGVKLVISDHHLGRKATIASVYIGAAWQR